MEKKGQPQRASWPRGRVAGVVALVVILVAGVALAFAPATWLATLAGVPGALSATLTAAGIRPAPLVVALVALTALLVWRPRPRRRRWPAALAPFGAPVAIYFDLENQAFTARMVENYVTHVRERIRGRRADLFYFADLSLPQYAATAIKLNRAGFRGVHVPHVKPDIIPASPAQRRLSAVETKNIVDMELGLFALERAITGRRRQEIILIGNDADYFPLIRRLWELGHRVELWANTLQLDLKQLVRDLPGVTAYEYDDLFANKEARARIAPDEPPALRPAPQILSEAKRSAGVAPAISTDAVTDPAVGPLAARIDLAIGETYEQLRLALNKQRDGGGAYSDLERGGIFASKVGLAQAVRDLGLTGPGIAQPWLALLRAAGALSAAEPRRLPRANPPERAAASQRIALLLLELAAVTREMAAQDAAGRVALAAVRNAPRSTAAPSLAADLRAAVREYDGQLRLLYLIMNRVALLPNDLTEPGIVRLLRVEPPPEDATDDAT